MQIRGGKTGRGRERIRMGREGEECGEGGGEQGRREGIEEKKKKRKKRIPDESSYIRWKDEHENQREYKRRKRG